MRAVREVREGDVRTEAEVRERESCAILFKDSKDRREFLQRMGMFHLFGLRRNL